MDFRVSVIIPAYNAEKFIEKAINSVFMQSEVTEIILVNDGSTDKTQEIIEILQKTNPKIKIFHHNNNVNKGRSASRNLGIKNASGNIIAFLDADDFYMPNRFKSDKEIFNRNKNTEGVFNAVGFHFYESADVVQQESFKLYTVNQKVNPEELFEVLISGKHGHFQINGLSVKRSIFDKIGLFNEKLMVAEDTEVFWKMALKCRLETGIIDKPVAMRGVHGNNVFNREDLYKEYRVKMFESIFFWSGKNQVPIKKLDLLLNKLWLNKFKSEDGMIGNLKYWVFLFTKNPRALFTLLSIKYFPIVRLRKKLFPFLYRRV